MGSARSKPAAPQPKVTEINKDAYIGLPLQVTAPPFAAAGFTVICTAVKPSDMFHPPNGHVNERRVHILFDWETQLVREIHFG